MTQICLVEVRMADDGTYRAGVLKDELVVEEVWGHESIPGALHGLAEQMEAKARKQFDRRIFQEDGA